METKEEDENHKQQEKEEEEEAEEAKKKKIDGQYKHPMRASRNVHELTNETE